MATEHFQKDVISIQLQDVPFLGHLVASFATAVVLHSVQRFCKQDLHNLSKRTALHFQKTLKAVKSSKTIYQSLAYSSNKLFKSLYWVRQASARRWRVRFCCSVEQDDLKSCWVTALQLVGCSFSLGLFYYQILVFFSSWIFEFTVTVV